MKDCDVVAERLALGEPLDDLAAHVAGCAGCARLVEVPRRIGAARAALDPGLGFSARMTAGAQHRIAVRRRRRVTAGLAASVAASALGAFVLTRDPASPAGGRAEPAVAVPSPEAPVELGDADLAALVNLADTRRSRRLSADWKRIERPLAPYRRLVHHVASPAAGAAGGPADLPTVAPFEGDTP